MLNDLRSTPSSRLLSSTQQQQQHQQLEQQQQQHQEQSHYPYNNNYNVNNNQTTITNNSNGYQTAAWRGQQQRKSSPANIKNISSAPTSTATTITTNGGGAAAAIPCYNRQQLNYRTAITTATARNQPLDRQQQQQPNVTRTRSQQQQQQKTSSITQPISKLRARYSNGNHHSNNNNNNSNAVNTNNNNNNNNATPLRTATPTTAHFQHSPHHISGLSADAKQIQKLPLWSYQQRQLQQPQKLHVQVLQQQQATKAIVSQILQATNKKTTTTTTTATTKLSSTATATRTATATAAAASKLTTTKTTTTVIKHATVTGENVDKKLATTSATATATSATETTSTTTTKSTGNWFDPTSTDCFGLVPDKDTIWSSDPGPQHQQQQQQHNHHHQQIQNQFKTATTTNTNNSNGNTNNNNNNNINNRRLPFCGLDSIKGSDNNGEGGGGGGGGGSLGTTNLSFDLNLPNDPTVALLSGPNNVNNNNNNGNDNEAVSAAVSAIEAAASEQFHSLDANESSCCDDGQFEDDMQALLPKCQRLSRDELSQSRTSLVSSSDGGILAAGETSSETSRDGSDDCPPCDLGLTERLLLTHPVWFLPIIQRSGAVHFLQGKEEGNFIVRSSSQPNTMAVSVRLPPDTGPYIEHYLIQSHEGNLSLESSRFKFDSIPALIAHYAQCCDELPVQLQLPAALREVKNRQQLSSLALLGQEFWRYPMSCPKPQAESTEAQLLDAKSPNSLTETSGLGATVFSASGDSHGVPQTTAAKIFSPTNNLNGLFSQAGTPSDTNSSMSSFTTSGGQHMQVMSPESVDSVILTMSPVDMHTQRNGMMGLGNGGDLNSAPNNLSTFKSNGLAYKTGTKQQNMENGSIGIRPQRPKPPNTLNLDLRKPPAPPMRWFKPLSPNANGPDAANNFTVTTTVTFSVQDNKNSPQFVEVTTPAAATNNNNTNSSNATFQTFSKRLSPEGECKDTLSSQGSSSNGSRWHSQSSKDSNNSQRKILSPGSAGTPTSALGGSTSSKSRKSKARKESKHYQESDILESPQIYCRSNLGDKMSDYEDLWTQDPSDRAGLLSSFKPADGAQGKRPDLLAETPTITSLNANLLSPPNSSFSSSASPPHINDTATAPLSMQHENSADTQQLIQFSAAEPPRSRTGLLLPGLMTQSLNEDQLKNETTEGDTTPTAQTPISRSKQGSPFYAEPADALRQAGLATASILRRSQRGSLLPANHRHSEPPKSGVARTPLCPLLMPAEIEKIAGSLDELKKKQQQQAQNQANQQQQPSKRARARFEQWQLDSSWEFMSKQEELDEQQQQQQQSEHYGDYDCDEQWKSSISTSQDKENALGRAPSKENAKQKPVTVHQIIAKRLPDLNLPELVRCSTPPQQQQQHQQSAQPQTITTTTSSNIKSHHELNGSQKSFDSQNSCRLSAYDNVERNYSFCQSYFYGIDSAQSDDGTVFSEPWDSSQWDSIMPHDDTTITSDTIHLSKCRPVVSEDDTIVEELSTKEHNQDTLKAKKTNGRQKVATILRNPSMRDREVLCHPRNKTNPYGAGPGDSVRAYTLQLAQDHSSTFARNIENFISCTKESREAAPQVVMRNMRQFMNGMKNYLVKHGEGKFHEEVETARSHLKPDEFLNLDAILETVMHQLIVLPLREHLYGMFVDYYTRSEDIQLLAQNVKYACGRCAADFGIRATVTPPSNAALHAISNLLLRLQEAELPLDKLDIFLCVISTIFDATGCPRGQQLGADDFLPVLVYVVAKCGFVGAEIEAEFMWGLLQPTLLNGEPGYYLTALCSAVHVLKSFMASENESGTGSLDWRSSSLPACSSVLRVIIPDECNGSLQTRTLPVRPHTTTREVCRIIAHKARITNPQDYALFKLVDGEETLLNETECPQDIRLASIGKHCMLAYKRIDAKIAWPTAATQSTVCN